MVLVGLLDEKSDTTLLAGDDTDGLYYGINIVFFFYSHSCLAQSKMAASRTLFAIEPSFCAVSADMLEFSPEPVAYLAAVDVPQVKRVARELDAVRPLDERGAASLCQLSTPVLRAFAP